MQTWKYHVEELELSQPDASSGPPDEKTPEEILEEQLYEAGSGGWELVCLLPARGSDSKVLAIFKQPATQSH